MLQKPIFETQTTSIVQTISCLYPRITILFFSLLRTIMNINQTLEINKTVFKCYCTTFVKQKAPIER